MGWKKKIKKTLVAVPKAIKKSRKKVGRGFNRGATSILNKTTDSTISKIEQKVDRKARQAYDTAITKIENKVDRKVNGIEREMRRVTPGFVLLIFGMFIAIIGIVFIAITLALFLINTLHFPAVFTYLIISVILLILSIVLIRKSRAYFSSK